MLPWLHWLHWGEKGVLIFGGIPSRFIEYLLEAGFYKEREIAFPFKQAALMMIKREAWEAPVL